MQSKCNNEDCHLSVSCWNFQKPKIDSMQEKYFEAKKIELTCDHFVDIDDVDIEEVQIEVKK